MADASPTERTRVRRLPERGNYDRDQIAAILDEALICHVGYVGEDGTPRVIPTIHARIGDTLYFHGSRASQTLRTLREGMDVCLVATIVDALVIARSTFHSSMNYRSVVVFGAAREVTERNEQIRVARAIADHVAPGRGDEAREPNDSELRQTLMLAIPLDEASAKIRTGPPHDEVEDFELDIWSGILPLLTVPGSPEPDPTLRDGIPVADSVRDYRRP